MTYLVKHPFRPLLEQHLTRWLRFINHCASVLVEQFRSEKTRLDSPINEVDDMGHQSGAHKHNNSASDGNTTTLDQPKYNNKPQPVAPELSAPAPKPSASFRRTRLTDKRQIAALGKGDDLSAAPLAAAWGVSVSEITSDYIMKRVRENVERGYAEDIAAGLKPLKLSY